MKYCETIKHLRLSIKKPRQSTVNSWKANNLWASVMFLGLAACTQTVPNVPAQPNGAVIELRYLSGSATHPAIEGVHCFALEEFTANANGPSWRGAGFAGEEPVRVALLKRGEDAEKPGNLLLKFAVAAEGEVFEIPEVSWNRRDEVLLAAGEGWLVKLEKRNEE